MIYKYFRSLVLVLSAISLLGCASTSSNVFDSAFKDESNKREINNVSEIDVDELATKNELIIENVRDDIDVSAMSNTTSLLLGDENVIVVAYEDLDLEVFIKRSLSSILNVNFLLDPAVDFNGKTVTLSVNEKVSEKRYFELFKDVLNQNGLTYKVQNGLVYVHPRSRQNGIPEFDFGYGRDKDSVPYAGEQLLQIVPLRYIDAKSLQTFIVRLSNASPELMSDEGLIALRGPRQEILRALDVVSLIDAPEIKGKHLAFVQLDYIPAAEFVEKIDEILTNEGLRWRTTTRFTELGRQNSVIVHSSNIDIIQRVEYWKNQIDFPEATEEKQYFIYYPENIEAESLGSILAELASIGTKSRQGINNSANTPAQQVSSTSLSSVRSANSQDTENLLGELQFVADSNRNNLIIYASGSKYKNLLPLLKKLDVSPPQVLIEARLLEVTLTDQLSQGIDWSLFGGARKQNIATSQLTSFAGGSFAYTISGIDYNLAISMLQNQDKLKVLSSPRIVVASGEKATINVGTEIPVLATQAADVDTDRVLQSVQYRSTGVDLTVNPIVNSNNVISLQIQQNVSETSENASSGIDSPIILNRAFNTKVIARSGQSLVLGGLIRENNSMKDSGIPLLGHLPGIGSIFSSESKSTSRTELVVIITPRIISSSSDIDDIKNIFLKELRLFNSAE